MQYGHHNIVAGPSVLSEIESTKGRRIRGTTEDAFFKAQRLADNLKALRLPAKSRFTFSSLHTSSDHVLPDLHRQTACGCGQASVTFVASRQARCTLLDVLPALLAEAIQAQPSVVRAALLSSDSEADNTQRQKNFWTR